MKSSEHNLCDLLRSGVILLDVPLTDKEDLIRSMVDRLAATGLVESPSQVVLSLLERERVMSTAVGHGVALPHARSRGVRQTCVALARPAQPVDFAALDGQPVELVFLVVDPGDRTELMQVLGRISELMQKQDLRKRLVAAKTPSDVLRVIGEAEARLKP